MDATEKTEANIVPLDINKLPVSERIKIETIRVEARAKMFEEGRATSRYWAKSITKCVASVCGVVGLGITAFAENPVLAAIAEAIDRLSLAVVGLVVLCLMLVIGWALSCARTKKSNAFRMRRPKSGNVAGKGK
jgi:hypothetical protein